MAETTTNHRQFTLDSFFLEKLAKQTDKYDSTPEDRVPFATNGWKDDQLHLSPQERIVLTNKALLEDQKRSIVSLNNGKDVIWQARTGCGKTTGVMWSIFNQAFTERQQQQHSQYDVRVFRLFFFFPFLKSGWCVIMNSRKPSSSPSTVKPSVSSNNVSMNWRRSWHHLSANRSFNDGHYGRVNFSVKTMKAQSMTGRPSPTSRPRHATVCFFLFSFLVFV